MGIYKKSKSRRKRHFFVEIRDTITLQGYIHDRCSVLEYE